MIDFRPLIHPDFWFALHPASLASSSARALVAVFSVVLIIGAIVRMVARRRGGDRYVIETFMKGSRLLTTMGFLGLVWLFFAVEEITFLQARYWFLLWVIGLFVWLFFLWRYVHTTVPRERLRQEAFRERNKFLPLGNRR